MIVELEQDISVEILDSKPGLETHRPWEHDTTLFGIQLIYASDLYQHACERRLHYAAEQNVPNLPRTIN